MSEKIMLELRSYRNSNSILQAFAEVNSQKRLVAVGNKTHFSIYSKLSKMQRRSLREKGRCFINLFSFLNKVK